MIRDVVAEAAPEEAVMVPPLTREQLAEVRESVLEVAAQRGLEEERALTVADAVVARLALAGPGRRIPGRS